MPESTSALPPCSNCGGFRTVAITTGLRCADGSRGTTLVHCAAHQLAPTGSTVRATVVFDLEPR
ncbi:hypothetical protein [Streptomyces marincola]|uniref:hypothetical protein n=1 Tax=Streptomyces marincola TaxID=2878388 RepID=UPI001CF4783B|nr:hypothetical protein [Streptomyces marincola]UCM88028.1 hypothetical protein LC193_08700 [Streptomyces marincola]